MTTPYASAQPARADIDALGGLVVLEFGTDWCGICRGAQPLIEQALGTQPGWRRMKVEDGPGRPLGRSFHIKLWPTLILLRDGVEVERLVRPDSSAVIADALMRVGR